MEGSLVLGFFFLIFCPESGDGKVDDFLEDVDGLEGDDDGEEGLDQKFNCGV